MMSSRPAGLMLKRCKFTPFYVNGKETTKFVLIIQVFCGGILLNPDFCVHLQLKKRWKYEWNTAVGR